MTRGFLIGTIALIALLGVWFAVQEQVVPARAIAGETEAGTDVANESTDDDEAGGSLPDIAVLVAVVVVPLGAMALIIRLQRRRRAAFKKAARHQKEQARAAELASREEMDH